MKPIRNRIVAHEVVRAGDLVPHPLNYRRHPAKQRAALAASYEEIGFARSLLGYRLPDGRIQLIDGHLRREIDPNMPVTVEVLDVTEEEARQLLLSIDPLAALAEMDEKIVRELAQMTRSDSQVLNDFWQGLAPIEAPPADPKDEPLPAEQFLILVECASEEQQVQLLEQFQAQGLTCRALLS
jgi:hypothetical protein